MDEKIIGNNHKSIEFFPDGYSGRYSGRFFECSNCGYKFCFDQGGYFGIIKYGISIFSTSIERIDCDEYIIKSVVE